MKQIREEQIQALAHVVGSREKALELLRQWETESEELKTIGVKYKALEIPQDIVQAAQKRGISSERLARAYKTLGESMLRAAWELDEVSPRSQSTGADLSAFFNFATVTKSAPTSEPKYDPFYFDLKIPYKRGK